MPNYLEKYKAFILDIFKIFFTVVIMEGYSNEKKLVNTLVLDI